MCSYPLDVSAQYAEPMTQHHPQTFLTDKQTVVDQY